MLHVPKTTDYLEILREALHPKPGEEENLIKNVESLYTFLTKPDEVKKC